jgi:hypothetical protein
MSQYTHEDELVKVVMERLSDRPPLQIAYEEIQSDPNETFHRVLRYLGVDDISMIEEEVLMIPTKKPPGILAKRLRDTYLGLKRS